MASTLLGIIYQIRNVDNNKVYIGSTLEFKARRRKHFWELKNKQHKNFYLQRSYDESPPSFVFEIIVHNVPEENLLQLESDEISCYIREGKIDRDYCYNLQIDPVRGQTGLKRSDETKLKMRMSQLGKKQSKEFCEKNRLNKLGNSNWLGKKHTEETKHKISISRSGKEVSLKTREKLRDYWLGRKHSPESIIKMKLSWIKRKMDRSQI